MIETILKPIAADLEYTTDLLRKEFNWLDLRTGNFPVLEPLLMMTSLRPALVILSSRLFGGDPEKTAHLAVVMQYIYYASLTHDAIASEEPHSGIKGNDRMSGDRFYILLGDYFHSRAAVILQGAGIKGMMRPIADIVCQMQEARLQKRTITSHNAAVSLDHIRKESAELIAGCCLLGARLAGASERDQESLASYGRNLGIALRLAEQEDSPKKAADYLNKAREALLTIPPQPERAILEQLTEAFTEARAKARRLVG